MRTIGLVFDPHVVADDRRSTDGVAVVRAAVEKLNDVGVDWTVIGGDCRPMTTPVAGHTDWGGWHGDPENYYYRAGFERAKELFDTLDSDYHVIRGNNDRPLSVFRETFPEEEHPRWGWFEEDGARYVFLDSNPHQGYHQLTECQNFVSSPQLSMLERLMDRDPETPTFVFCHAPLAKHTELHDDWETRFTGGYYVTANHLSVQHVLERGTTVLVNSGHVHPDFGRGSKRIGGVEYVLARHLVHNPDPEYAGDVRWMTVDTDARRSAVHYYDVGADEEGTITEATW